MKILNPKNDILYLTKEQWAKLFFALSIMLIVLYSIAMTASLCGCDYFILNFDNRQLDNIEVFLNNLHVMPLMSCVFLTIEFAIILAFTIKRLPKWYYLLSFYALRIVLSFFGNMPPIVNLIYPLTFYLTIPVIEQIKDFAYKVFDMLKRAVDDDIYDEIEIDLYKEVYGCHFNKWLLEKALSKMINDDGTIGGHFKLDQTIMMARSNGIDFKTFNEYDFNYVINMLYSDFYGSVPNETSTYVKMAKKFLDDKDAREGKALRYYLSIK